jgi:hypothetical protein
MHDITKKGFSGEGVKKINQDNFFIYKNFNNNPNSIYFGVWYFIYNSVTAMALLDMKFQLSLEKICQ